VLPTTCEHGWNSIKPVVARNSSNSKTCIASSTPRHLPRRKEAIAREKQLQNWRRDWKIRLIETDNLDWSDLSRLL
jgi:predicted GIY-YIG superfamily endonuclease